MTLRLTPLSPALGAEVHDLNVAGAIDDATIGELTRALADRGLLLFREQVLTPERHVAFGARFGPPEPHVFAGARLEGHPEIYIVDNRKKKDAGTKRPYGGDYWHSDLSYRAEPSLGSLLYAREIPEIGGDTLYANMYLAYERLSEGMRRMLDGLTAVHDYHWASRAGGMPEGDADRETTAEHPVVRTHPVGGRRSLFVSQGFTRRFGGMTEEESAPILAMLAERSADPAIVYRHRWREGDLVFWDNRCTLHRAIRDYGDATRSMHRVTLRGERPTAAVARPIQFI